jgi:CRP-like cAMP-binding protein
MYALHEQTSQNVLCNRHHELESRLARWLLQVSDFTQSRTLLFKHSLLAELLGVTRSAVTIAAGRLLDDGLIRYSRGEIVILQRAQLRDAACECYKTLYKVYKTIYPTLF